MSSIEEGVMRGIRPPRALPASLTFSAALYNTIAAITGAFSIEDLFGDLRPRSQPWAAVLDF